MVKYNEAGKLVTVLDNILKFGSLTKASDASEIDAWTLARWRRRSEDGDEAFQQIEYRGLNQPFHMHVEDCIEQSIDEIESNLRANARDGYRRPIIWHGEYQYEPDEAAMAMNEQEFKDACDLGLAWPDKKLRVKNEKTGQWERVKMMEWLPPTVEAQTVVLRSWSDRYADRRSVKFEGNMDVNFVPGVTVMSDVPRVGPTPQQLEVLKSTDVTETVPLAAEPVIDAEYVDIAPQQPVEPDGPTILDAEQRRIMEQLRSQNPSARELAQKVEKNLKRRIAVGDPDVDPRRTGHGTVPDGGVKVA
jgi:hypothetical protein